MKIKKIFLHYWGVTIHKVYVLYYTTKFAVKLIYRGIIHDYTKYYPDEAEGFIRTILKLRTTSYGTPEYQLLLDELKPNLIIHYKRWKHHPEHYGDKGIRGMSLLDLVEMWCDWESSVKKHADGNLHKSIRVNKDRFKFSDDLIAIMENSINEKR